MERIPVRIADAVWFLCACGMEAKVVDLTGLRFVNNRWMNDAAFA